MISNYRAYFDQQIKVIDPDILPWERDVFGNNDLNQGQATRYYNLFFGLSSLDRDGNGYIINTPVTLDLFASTKRQIQNKNL